MLSEKAVIARISISAWQPKRLSKRASEVICITLNTDKNFTAGMKYLIDPSELSMISSLCSKARAYHYAETLPFGEHGDRLLASDLVTKYIAGINQIKDEFNVQVGKFVAKYDGLIEAARPKLGELWNPEDYPKDIASKFSISVQISPVPESGHFMVDLENENLREVKAKLDQELETQVNEALADVFHRVRKIVSKVDERLSAEKPRIYDSMINNVKDMIDTLPVLNVTGDKRIKKLIQEMQDTLGKRDPQELRESKQARQDTKAEAKRILNRLDAYAGRGK